MTTPRLVLVRAALLCATLMTVSAITSASLEAQVTFTGGSYTLSGGSPVNLISGGGFYRTDTFPSSTTAYAGGSLVDTKYIFGFLGTSSPSNPPVVANYNLGSTSLVAGTSLTLNFSAASRPKYIAYTGGELTSYSYNSVTRVLTLSLSTVNPVASASDTTGATLGSAFGLMIETGASAPDYHGAVFRTDMYWRDLNSMQSTAGYVGSGPLAGINASGVNGVQANFYAYVPHSLLTTFGITSAGEVGAFVQKDSGVSYLVEATKTWVTAGSSTFDFSGDGSADGYVLAAYSNSSWSAGNIGITAIPEPAHVAMGFAALALCAVGLQRRRTARAGNAGL